MLSFMRKNAGSFFIKAALLAVALSFIVGFGALGYLRRSSRQIDKTTSDFVAKVGDVEISRQQFIEELDQVKRRYASQGLGENSELFNSPFFMRSVMSNMIDITILRMAARDMGISVSDAEVADYLRRSGAFTYRGQFNKDRLVNYLRQTRQTAEEFEEGVRFTLRGVKLINLLQASVFASDDELWRSYQAENEKVSLEAVKFKPDMATFDPAVLTDEELKSSYDAAPEDWRAPETRRVAYFSLPVKDALEKVEVTDDQINEFYDKNYQRYKMDEQVRYRQITLVLPEGAAAADRDALKKKAETVLEEAKKPDTDFALLAEKFNEDKALPKDGDAGWQGRAGGDPSVKAKAFELKAGEVSDVIETTTGFAILKLTDTRQAGTQPLEEIKDKVRLEAQYELAKELTRKNAEAAYKEMQPGEDLVAFAEKKSYEASSTPFFSVKEGALGIEKPAEVGKAAFNMSKNQLGGPYEGQTRYYIYQLAEIKESAVPAFDEIKDKVRDKLAAKKKREILEARAAELLTAVRKGEKTLAQVAAELGTDVVETGPFASSAFSVPKLGYQKGLVEEAFSLTPPEEFPAKPFAGSDAPIIYRVVSRVIADRAAFEAARESIEKEFLETKRLRFLTEWVDGQRAKYPTVENQEFWARLTNKEG